MALQGLGHREDRGQLSWSGFTLPSLQVALDVVEEICAEMALTRPEAFSEYVIFVVTNRGEGPGGLGTLGPALKSQVRCHFFWVVRAAMPKNSSVRRAPQLWMLVLPTRLEVHGGQWPAWREPMGPAFKELTSWDVSLSGPWLLEPATHALLPVSQAVAAVSPSPSHTALSPFCLLPTLDCGLTSRHPGLGASLLPLTLVAAGWVLNCVSSALSA